MSVALHVGSGNGGFLSRAPLVEDTRAREGDLLALPSHGGSLEYSSRVTQSLSGAHVVLSRMLVASTRPRMTSTVGLLAAICMARWADTLTAAEVYCIEDETPLVAYTHNTAEAFNRLAVSSDSQWIVVDTSTLYRYERTGEGALFAIDNVTIEQGAASASSATADPTGDWVVIMVYQTLYSYYVGDETIEISQTVVGDAAIEDCEFMEITPDSESVYLASNGNSGLTYTDATVNVSTSQFFLGSTFTTESMFETDFVAVHPDGTRLYAGKKSNGKIRDYVRDPLDGSLDDEPCTDVNDANLVANRMLVSPNGMYLYVARGTSVKAYRTHTETPITPTPTEAPAPAPMATPEPTPRPDASQIGDSNEISAPELTSAELSGTESLFMISFNRTCYCTAGDGASELSFPPALCGQDFETAVFDQRCDVTSLLDESTRQFFGENTTTCQWSNGSRDAVVSFNESSVVMWDPAPNITLAGGYIYGQTNLSLYEEPAVFASGTVTLGLRQAAPELSEATFTSDGSSIVVSFSATGSASSGLVDPNDTESGSAGACDAIFRSTTLLAIGHGAICEWTSHRELTVILGSDASVVAESSSATTTMVSTSSCTTDESCIVLKDGGVRAEAYAVLSSEGSVPVLPPDNPSKASAVLVAPQWVGLCGEFSLDGRMSSGAASRSLAAVWNVSTTLASDSAAVTAVAGALKQFQGSLYATVNSTSLEPLVEFKISLIVENFLGSVDAAAVTVTRINEDAPSVVVVGPATKTAIRSRPASLRMAATPPACGDASSLSFTWTESGMDGYDALGTSVMENLVGNDPTALTIPAYTLSYPGSMYRFVATVSSGTLTSGAVVEIIVGQGALRAAISGGQYRQHTVGADLVLDGSESLDEDDVPEEEFPLRYSWSCSENCSGVADGYTGSDEAIFTIPSGSLEAGLVYEFSLNISKGTAESDVVYGVFRSDSATVQVQVVSFEAPEVVVAAKNDEEKVDPTQKVVIYGGVVDQSTAVEYVWTQVNGDLDLATADWSDLFTSTQTGAILVVRPFVLTGGSSYTFRLSAVDTASGETGFAEIHFDVNAPPSGGYVEATPRAGVAAIDMFSLEALLWEDDIEDLPLKVSFFYVAGQDETGTRRSLSLYEVESVEWNGPLPVGSAADNYTMIIIGHISDSYGATETSFFDESGQTLLVRVTAWAASSSGLSLMDEYTAVASVTEDIPGETTSIVRAFASLLIAEINNSAAATPTEEQEFQQTFVATMIGATVRDSTVLDYSTTMAGAILDTMVVLSSSKKALNTDSQAAILASSASILNTAAGEGYWDSGMYAPTVQVLDQVIGAYDTSSDTIVGSGLMGQDAASNLTAIVQSMVLLMEAGTEDGEGVMTIESEYVQASCLVTSSTGSLSFDTGTSSVSFEDGVIASPPSPSTRRRMTPEIDGGSKCKPGGCARSTRRMPKSSSRRLNSVSSTSTSTVVVTNQLFNANDRPSALVNGGVTQIKVSSTGDGEDIALAGPVQLTMRASMTSSAQLPSCSYYNEDTGRWDSEGLAIGAVAVPTDAGDSAVDVLVSCVTFHLSDFGVATTEVEPVFQPVTLGAGLSVVRGREITVWGILLTVGALILLGIVWSVSRIADHRSKTAERLQTSAYDHYIETGHPQRLPTLEDIKDLKQTLEKKHKTRRKKRDESFARYLRRKLFQRFRSWLQLMWALLQHVLFFHPWAGIIATSGTHLTLTRAQLSLLIFTQVMVIMMLSAAVSGNATSPKVEYAQILASLAATLPASIIVPRAFASSATPPPSVTAKRNWLQVVTAMKGNSQALKLTPSSEYGGKSRWVREPNYFLAAIYLVAARVRKFIPRGGALPPRDPGIGDVLARGAGILLAALVQLVLNIVCGCLCFALGADHALKKALSAAVVGSHVQSFLFLDAFFSNKATMFTLLSYKAVFNLVFVSLGLTTLQLVLAFYCMQMAETGFGLYLSVFIISLIKLIVCQMGELVPSMDAINEHTMTQMSFRKKYNSRNQRRRSSSFNNSTETRMLAQEAAAVVIQARVRGVLHSKRSIRRKEVLAWQTYQVQRIRRKLTAGTYMLLATYTVVVVYINLCYVMTYDNRTAWHWAAASFLTVFIDVLLRKPLSVLAASTLHTIRRLHSAPHGGFIGKRS
ncbi:unnamed protein product [Ectocarpus sp. 6 AP-2014]